MDGWNFYMPKFQFSQDYFCLNDDEDDDDDDDDGYDGDDDHE